jgi:hypothetical protein
MTSIKKHVEIVPRKAAPVHDRLRHGADLALVVAKTSARALARQVITNAKRHGARPDE